MSTCVVTNMPALEMPNVNSDLTLVNNLLLTNVNNTTSNQYNYIIQNSKYLSVDNIMNNPFFINSSDATTHIRHYLENVGSHYTIISKFDKDLHNKSLTIDYLTYQLLNKQTIPKIDNLLEFD